MDGHDRGEDLEDHAGDREVACGRGHVCHDVHHGDHACHDDRHDGGACRYPCESRYIQIDHPLPVDPCSAEPSRDILHDRDELGSAGSRIDAKYRYHYTRTI